MPTITTARRKLFTAARPPNCECGQWSGVRCEGSAPPSRMVTVETMPEHLRASHEAAGNSGSYPHNGAVRLTVTRACARIMLDTDGDWCSRVPS